MKSSGRKQDVAVSEIIGTVLLISIVVLAGSIIAVAVLSHPQAQKIPALSALISNQSQIVYIKHDGGDSLANGSYEILVDGTDVTSSINKTGSSSTWSIGDVITYDKPGTTPPSTVQIVYTGTGSPVVIAASYFGMLTSAGTITATPTPTPIIYYTINASASAGGSISPAGNVTVASGTSQTFTITPDAGYSITSVLVDGSPVSSNTTYTFTNIQADHTIAASFAINTYTITASAGTGGSISPSGSVNVAYGNNQTFNITPNTGYSITTVLVDGSSVGSVPTYTFTNVTAPHTIAASFAINTYTITASAGTGGSISPSGSVNVAYGNNQTFNITPNTGYSISGVSVDMVSQGAITSYTFTNVQAPHNISASFAPVPPTYISLTPAAGPIAGGTSVTITGSGFTTATTVTFGGTSASFTVNNDTSVTATTPAHVAGAVDVVVTTPGGSATGTGAYTYVAAPTFVSISPAAGPTSGGQTVTITGTNFVIGATSVSIGGTAATGVSVSTSTTLTATTPAGSAGLANVVITTAGGSATGTGAYTYVTAPTFGSISPETGPSLGGTSVTITGTNFVIGATSVSIGGTAATSISVSTSTTLTATTPAGSAGLANVVVTTAGGSATGTGVYDYYTIQIFTAVGTTSSAVPSGATTVQYLVVAGGGGGGGLGGGGGAGGFLTGTLTGLSSSYTVTVGGGGAGGTTAHATSGSNSVFGTITATGGGWGGTSSGTATTRNGGNGGSGGGAARTGTFGTGTAGQGNNGGTGQSLTGPTRYLGGGGGGASAAGGSSTGTAAGNGGAGTALPITGATGVPATYAGGGGGGGTAGSGDTAGSGGAGGGGAGSVSGAGTAGTANTGGGGGGSDATTASGGAGGSGIVILKYY